MTRRVVAALVILGGLGLLTDVSASARSFAGSNGRIAFTSRRDGNSEIYVMDSDGSNQTQLTFDPGSDGCPAWSPDGTRVAFDSDRDGAQIQGFNTFDVYVMGVDGSNLTRLTDTPGHGNTCPSWSPDGTKLVFTSDRDNADPADYFAEIYVMGADGSNQTRLTFHEAITSHAAWSPDGTKIAYSTNRDTPGTDNYEIYVMGADGSTQTRLTDNAPFADYEPAWSPDGTRMAIVSKRLGFQWDIWVIDADGSNPIQLTNSGPVNRDSNPDWSPDGTKIAFTSNLANEFESEIYVMEADGSNPTRLTNTPQGLSAGPSWESRISPLETTPESVPPQPVDSTTTVAQVPTGSTLPATGTDTGKAVGIAVAFVVAGTALAAGLARRRSDAR